MYVLNQFLTADRSWTVKYFWKSLVLDGSPHLNASSGTFCIKIGHFLEAQWGFEKCLKKVKFLKENEVDFEILWKFRISLWLKYLTNLNAKGAERSVKMWASSFFMSFF